MCDREAEMKVTDPIHNAIGPMGKWHMWVCGVIFLMKFPVAWHQMAIIFLAPPVNFKCLTPNITDKCSSECSEIEYDRSIFSETIITEWDLVCNRSQLANLSQTIVMLGILFGNFSFGVWSDKIGRRIPLVCAVFLQLFAGVATSFVPWFWLFCILRFLTAFATGGTMTTSFVIIMEIIGVKWRELVSVLFQIPYTLGHLSLAGFGYYFRDWHYFQFGISIPSIVLISYYWLIPESPRWLFITGQLQKSAEILEKAAKQNNLPTDKILFNLEEAAKLKSMNETDQTSKGNVFDLVRTSNMRAKTLCIAFNWFVCGLTFFGVSQYVGQIGDNLFSNFAIGAALTIPGILICILMMKYWGRKLTLIISNTVAGVALLCIALLPPNLEWAIVALSSTGIVAMSIAFPNMYLFSGEIFPTIVRNVGMGSVSMVARIGSMLAPFVVSSSTTAHWLPPVIFGLVPLIGAALAIRLPETVGQALPETIEDGERFGKPSEEISDSYPN